MHSAGKIIGVCTVPILQAQTLILGNCVFRNYSLVFLDDLTRGGMS